MKNFMDKDFLLENETAKILFHEYAAKMPEYISPSTFLASEPVPFTESEDIMLL